MKTVRFFLSSPGDVGSERAIAGRVFDRLRPEYAGRAALEAYFWEHEPMRATQDFQEQIPPPSAFDVVICILWSRLGTRLHARHSRPDGTPYDSGTEYEFEDAALAAMKQGTPELLVYLNRTPVTFPAEPEDELRRRLDQYQKLKAFTAKWFFAPDQTIRAAFNTYTDLAGFEEQFEAHLRSVIDRLAPAEASDSGADAPRATWTKGSPFRGLQSFEFEHAPVFFGRTRAIGGVREGLRRQALAGRPFVLVAGMSGSGKSSLVKAGVLPLLTRPGVMEGIGLWRWAALRPSDQGGDPWRGLAEALLRPAALPELAAGATAPDVARLLRERPGEALGLIRGALTQAAAAVAREEKLARIPEARLALVVDQMEELFTHPAMTKDTPRNFVRLLKELTGGGRVWVLATLRSDFLHRCEEVPELIELKSGEGQYQLEPPGAAEIGQLIRLPALAAGLQFERDGASGERLDDLLRDAALRDPGALPLLEFALEELFQRRAERPLLTLRAYREMGGIEGALQKRAEDEFGKLTPAAQQAFEAVFAELVQVSAEADDQPVRRRAPQARLHATPAAKELTEAFVAARLLVADDGPHGPEVAVAHEALLRAWRRLSAWIAGNREFLAARARLGAAARRWIRENRASDLLLPEGKPLAEARDLWEKRRGELPPEVAELASASLAFAARRRRRRRIGMAAVSILVLGFVGLWLHQRSADARMAVAAANTAVGETDFALASLKMEKGDWPSTLAYLADALRKNPQNEKAAVLAVSLVRSLLPPLAEMRQEGSINVASFSPDGKRVVTASSDGTARIWDAQTGQPVGPPLKHEDAVNAASFSPDGKWVVTASSDKTARVWDAQTGQPVGAPLQHGDTVNFASFSPDGKRVVTASSDGTARIWDAQTGQPVGEPMKHGDAVNFASFSPDGKWVATASSDYSARIWDAETGAPVGRRMMHDERLVSPTFEVEGPERVVSVRFSPDSQWVVTASTDNMARVWDARTGAPHGQPMIHRSGVNSASFSPDGKWVVTASTDSTARVWDAQTGAPVSPPLPHGGAVISARFSPDGKRVVTASTDNTARIWDAQTGTLVAQPMSHNYGVNSASFSPDGRRVVTASWDKTARVWSAQSGIPVSEPVKPEDSETYVDFNPNSHLAPPPPLADNAQVWARAWRAQTGPSVGRPMEHEERVNSASFSPDGKRVVTASDGNVAQIWDAQTGAPVGRPMKHGNHVNSASFSPDGKRVVTAATDNTAQVWDAQTDLPVGRPMKHDKMVFSASFSSNGKGVVTASMDKTARVWDAQTGAPVSPPLRHDDWVNSARFSPDGKWVVTASSDATARVWNASTGAPVSPPIKHREKVNFASFSPDGKRVATASFDKTARIWDASTGAAVGQPMQHGGPVNSAMFSPDGRWVVTASDDRTARVWDAQTGMPMGQPMKHENEVTFANFSPDGKWVVTASKDMTARVWDAQTGRPVGRPLEHGDEVDSVGFSPNGKWVVTASLDKTARVWDVIVADGPAPSWLSDLAEATGGQWINPQGALEASPQDPAQIRRGLQKLAGADDLSRFGRWFAADPATRTIDRFSALAMPEYIAGLLRENTPESIKAAYLADSGNPAVLAALATLTFKSDKDEAAFYFRIALRYARLAGAPEQIAQVQASAKSLFPTALEFNEPPPGAGP